MIKIKARGYDRTSKQFVDKWLNTADINDEAGIKELRKALFRMALAEAKAMRSTTFRLVIVPDDDDEGADLINFSSKPKKKSKTVDDDDEDDDE